MRVGGSDLTVSNWEVFGVAGGVLGVAGEVHLDTQAHHGGRGGVWCPAQGSDTASVMNCQRSLPKRALGLASKVRDFNMYIMHNHTLLRWPYDPKYFREKRLAHLRLSDIDTPVQSKRRNILMRPNKMFFILLFRCITPQSLIALFRVDAV